MAKRKQYDDQFRASAVLMLEAAGYPSQAGALSRVSEQLSVPARTLSRWFRGEQNPPPDQMVSEKRIDFIVAIEAEMDAVLKAMNVSREDASYRDHVTALGILVDKRQLLSGGATERQEVKVGITTIEVVKTVKTED